MKRTPLSQNILVKIDKESQTAEGGLVTVSGEGKRTDSVALRAVVISLPESVYIVDNRIKFTDVYGREQQITLKKGDVVEVSKFELTYTTDPDHAYVALDHVLGKIEG